MPQLAGESPIDNLQLPNIMRRHDALLLTAGRRALLAKGDHLLGRRFAAPRPPAIFRLGAPMEAAADLGHVAIRAARLQGVLVAILDFLCAEWRSTMH